MRLFIKSIFMGVLGLGAATGHANSVSPTWDAAKVMKRLEKSVDVKLAFTARARSKLMVANQTITDSGKIEVLPPYCQKITLSGTAQSTCGDTTWVRMPNGDVTRSVGANPKNLPGIGGSAMGFLPIPRRNEKSKVGASDSAASMAVVPGTLRHTLGLKIGGTTDDGEAVMIEIDTLQWVPVKMTVQVPGQPPIDIGVKFTLWKGYQVMTEMRMVIPNGFMVFEILDYQSAKGLKRRHFKLL